MVVERPTTETTLFGNGDYRLWWAGNLCSNIGNQLVLVGLPLMVLLITGSAAQAGLVASIEAVPYLVLALPAGILVDRFPRRTLMLITSAVSAVAFLSVPIAYAADDLHLVHIYGVALVNGCATVVFAVAQQSSLPHVVDDRHLGQAVGQTETIERLAAIVGPALAAWLFEMVWPAAPFALNALSFVIVALAIAGIRRDLGPRGTTETPADQGLLIGVRTLLRYPLLRDLTLINSAGDLLFAGIALLVILLVRGNGDAGVSVGLALSIAAVGGVLGSLLTHRIERRLGVATAVIGKHVLTAAMFPVFLLDLPAVVVGLVLAVISFQVSVVGVIQRKYLLKMTPNGVLGQTTSVVTFLSFGSLPVGTALTGFALDHFGTDRTVLLYTGALTCLAIATVASRPIRRARRATAERSKTDPQA